MPSHPAPLTRDSKAEATRKRQHAVDEARSQERRRAQGAPRRDDLARAAYYALLLFCEDAETPAEAAAFRDPLLAILVKAGFARDICARLFDRHSESLVDDLDGWLAYRWYAESKRLAKDRGRYSPLPRVPLPEGYVGSPTLALFSDTGGEQSAADRG